MKNPPKLDSPRQVALLAVLLLAVVSAVAIQDFDDTRESARRRSPKKHASSPITGGDAVTWNDVDKLISEQKFEAASEAVAAIRERARADGDAAEWTRALVEETKLRMALHGYETAVRFLRTEPWPEDAVSQAVLELYYANALATYARSYSWEIRQRERVETSGELDLEKWDLEQIVEEADRAFHAVWSAREEWGNASLGELSRYIQQNSYPPRIRGTLRDAVTYMWVELLADTIAVEPRGVQRALQARRGRADRRRPAGSAGLDLADPSVHPLLKIGALLDDLEDWHRAAGRSEAALEARLERLRRLARAPSTSRRTSSPSGSHLEQVQDWFDRSLDWWSMGQAVLAELIRQEIRPDASGPRPRRRSGRSRPPPGEHRRPALRSHRGLDRGPGLQPRGDGGRRPGAPLAAGHPSQPCAAPLPRLALRPRASRSRNPQDYNLLADHREAEEIMAGPPDAEWSAELPPTPDYRSHLTYDVPQLTQPGAYLVAASMRADFAHSANQIVAANFILSDLVLVRRHVGQAYEVTARSGESGRALPGVEVSLYRYNYRRGHRLVETRRTGEDGRVSFGHALWRREQHFLMARHGDHVALDGDHMYRYDETGRGSSSSALIYTDRWVYRPRQTIFWKAGGLPRRRREVSYKTLPNRSIEIDLLDANGENVASASVKTNGFGSASGSFEIPAGPAARAVAAADLPRRHEPDPRRGVQAADLRGRARRPGGAPAAQPRGGAHRRRRATTSGCRWSPARSPGG